MGVERNTKLILLPRILQRAAGSQRTKSGCFERTESKHTQNLFLLY